MATSHHADGNVIDHVAGAAILSGDIVVTGDIVGVALTDIANTATGAVAIEGVWNVAKATGTAWVQGDSLDWDASGSEFDLDIAVPAAGDVENCAVAYVDAGSADAVGIVKLTPGTGATT